jgi:hypothetical protein
MIRARRRRNRRTQNDGAHAALGGLGHAVFHRHTHCPLRDDGRIGVVSSITGGMGEP